MGKTISNENGNTYKVTAVIEDIPYNSHLKPDILCSFVTKKKLEPLAEEGYGFKFNSYRTYVKLREGVDPVNLEMYFPNY